MKQKYDGDWLNRINACEIGSNNTMLSPCLRFRFLNPCANLSEESKTNE
ncbi:hypothetical protein IIB79_09790 [candidate division KSB1 bacterium]|nr:hypothetical protein [candidate division KSB1 bacterium]